MKSFHDIRAHRNDLLRMVSAPCECVGIIAVLQCMAARQDAAKAANLLSWVLGEKVEYEDSVERVAAAVRRG
jgi:malonyl CoA-acyl carrier protein transacylase